MSKLYNTYLALKKQDSETIYLFKSGIFFIAIDKDAYTLANIFHFKIGNLTHNIVKCGFPCSSFNKYSNLFKAHNLTTKVIEPNDNVLYSLNDYKQSQSITEILDYIKDVDTNNLSITEAYQWIEDLKSKTEEFISGENL